MHTNDRTYSKGMFPEYLYLLGVWMKNIVQNSAVHMNDSVSIKWICALKRVSLIKALNKWLYFWEINVIKINFSHCDHFERKFLWIFSQAQVNISRLLCLFSIIKSSLNLFFIISFFFSFCRISAIIPDFILFHFLQDLTILAWG